MNQEYKPAIIIVAYNRHLAVERLLKSLDNCMIPSGTPLVISIDKSDNHKVVELANQYSWKYGEKRVIAREERYGLRKHVLTCGDLTNDYGSIIMLEDDSYLVPSFYKYTQQALAFYDDSDKIAGISLYVYQINPLWELPFWHLSDDSDVYFVQRASSLGQAWSKKQWNGFREWYDLNHKSVDMSNLPGIISRWPETSWLKYFIKYLVDFDKYFVYPKASFTTNFMDIGTHVKKIRYDYQTYLQYDYPEFRFKRIEDSYCLYDVYFELIPERIKQLNPFFKNYDFCNDLYGKRDIKEINRDYVLTTRRIKNPITSFQRALKPHELNPIMNIEGTDIYFGEKNKIFKNKHDDILQFVNNFEYFYRRELSQRDLVHYLKYKFFVKIGLIK